MIPETIGLLPHHAEMLAASGLTDDVITARGYRSLTKKADVLARGFSPRQANVPGLLVPVLSPVGEIATYQFRPDQPRVGREGKPVKYETPRGARMALDVPASARAHIGAPSVPLIVTEGVKKADAAACRGLCCVALLGVWNFVGTNEHGGKTALAEWREIALNGRTLYICFDSDAMHKPEVHRAMAELASFLAKRGARVLFLYLPHGEAGRKVGLDDYLAAGHTTDELLALARPDLRPLPGTDDGARQGIPYRETPRGLVWDRDTASGPQATPLTNFTARIVADVVRDDGAETQRQFEVEVRLNGRAFRFPVAAGEYDGLRWVTKHLGAGAILYPGLSVREHAAVAIKMLSGEIAERRVYAHTGWAEVADGRWVYLHAGGAVGSEGADVSVELSPSLELFRLPPPPTGADAVDAVRASLRLLDLAPDGLTVPLLAATYRAALGPADFSVFLAGPSGSFKSEAAALAQQHYGSGLDSRHLPGAWSSTDNALEGLTFTLKDALCTIDDFAPTGTINDVQALHRKADRVLRAQGNRSGRGRMNADGTLRPDRPPRGTVLATGEDLPQGQSVRARLLVVEVAHGDIPADRLTACQRDAAEGLYAASMAGFLAWLAPQYDSLRQRLKSETDGVREALAGRAGQAGHRRSLETAAQMAVGWRYFLRFARESGALTAEDEKTLRRRGVAALVAAVSAQAQHQTASEPAQRYLELLAGAIAAGQAHVAGKRGEAPPNAGAWGWRETPVGEEMQERPQGERIGWVDGEDLYLSPDVAYKVARRLGSEGSEGIAVSPKTLSKRLHERRLLRATDAARNTLTVRQTLEGSRKNVLHLAAASLLGGETDQTDQTAPEGPVLRVNGAPDGPFSGSVSAEIAEETDQKNCPQPPRCACNAPSNGRNGRPGQASEPVGHTKE